MSLLIPILSIRFTMSASSQAQRGVSNRAFLPTFCCPCQHELSWRVTKWITKGLVILVPKPSQTRFAPSCSCRWLGLPRPDFYRQAKWRNFFVVRWVYEGFSSKELVFIIGATAGLLVGFGTTGRIVLE